MPKSNQLKTFDGFQLTRQSRNDLLDIWVFIAEDNQTAADKLIAELRDKFHLLAKNPKMGTNRFELRANLQSLAYKKYVIFYTEIDNGIEIYRVLHSSRDIGFVFLQD